MTGPSPGIASAPMPTSQPKAPPTTAPEAAPVVAASGAFAYYTSQFASYNKTWGSLAAVIIMLTWLWLSALALLIGGEINAETQRSRELRQPTH